jgi:3-phenylpropionate/trans-cinnamate dioxygenase ferredoxin subunit
MTAKVEQFASARFWRQGRIEAPDLRPQRARNGRLARKDIRSMSEKKFVAAMKLEDLPAGTKKLVEIDGLEIVLCNTLDRIFAVRNLCSHAHERLDCGKMKNGWIACPVHGARFDLETGEAMNPPATLPVSTYEVRVVGDTIEVAV